MVKIKPSAVGRRPIKCLPRGASFCFQLLPEVGQDCILNVHFNFKRDLFFLPRQGHNAIILPQFRKIIGQRINKVIVLHLNVHTQGIIRFLITEASPCVRFVRENQGSLAFFCEGHI